jgi:hypothetical protein
MAPARLVFGVARDGGGSVLEMLERGGALTQALQPDYVHRRIVARTLLAGSTDPDCAGRGAYMKGLGAGFRVRVCCGNEHLPLKASAANVLERDESKTARTRRPVSFITVSVRYATFAFVQGSRTNPATPKTNIPDRKFEKNSKLPMRPECATLIMHNFWTV